MSFVDLPKDWSRHPIEEARCADVVDLFVGERDRAHGCLAFLVLDGEGRMRSPMIVGDVPADADPDRVLSFLGHLADTLRASRGSVIFVRGRAGEPFLTDADRRWHELALAGLADDDMPLLRAAYLATPGVVRAFPASLTIADLAS